MARSTSWLSHERYPRLLLALLLVFAALLGFAPHDRADWLLENALLFLGVGILIATHRALPLSRISYTLIFLFLCLHTVGAHYTYSLVPYDELWSRLFGRSLNEALGFERGVSHSWDEAPIFMGLFTGLVILGAILALIPGLPLIQVLVGVYVLNGLLLPIELFAILRLINNPELMGSHVNGRLHNILAWAIAILVSLLSLMLIALTVLGWFGIG